MNFIVTRQGLGQARPNKITWKTRKSLRSEVTDGQKIFKNKKFVGTGRFLHSTAALKTHFRELFPNC